MGDSHGSRVNIYSKYSHINIQAWPGPRPIRKKRDELARNRCVQMGQMTSGAGQYKGRTGAKREGIRTNKHGKVGTGCTHKAG